MKQMQRRAVLSGIGGGLATALIGVGSEGSFADGVAPSRHRIELTDTQRAIHANPGFLSAMKRYGLVRNEEAASAFVPRDPEAVARMLPDLDHPELGWNPETTNVHLFVCETGRIGIFVSDESVAATLPARLEDAWSRSVIYRDLSDFMRSADTGRIYPGLMMRTPAGHEVHAINWNGAEFASGYSADGLFHFSLRTGADEDPMREMIPFWMDRPETELLSELRSRRPDLYARHVRRVKAWDGTLDGEKMVVGLYFEDAGEFARIDDAISTLHPVLRHGAPAEAAQAIIAYIDKTRALGPWWS